MQASIIWIIGEYAERIDNADEQLEHFLETFEEESAEVQLQLLTATVKLFLKQPEDTQVLGSYSMVYTHFGVHESLPIAAASKQLYHRERKHYPPFFFSCFAVTLPAFVANPLRRWDTKKK